MACWDWQRKSGAAVTHFTVATSNSPIKSGWQLNSLKRDHSLKKALQSVTGDTGSASSLTATALLNHSHCIKATYQGNYNSKPSLPPSVLQTPRWIMDAHCWAWEVRCVKAVIAVSHPLMPIVNTLRKGGWNFGFLATHEHEQNITLLYTLQEINTRRELRMYKGITQDMNSKIIIFELYSLVLKWDIILSLFFMYYTQVVEEQSFRFEQSSAKNMGYSASI